MTDRANRAALLAALTNEADYRGQGIEGEGASHVQAIRYAIAQIVADGRLEAEVERLNAIVHGMQDGALVRDQAALIGRLQEEHRALAEKYEAEDKRLDGEMKALEAENERLRTALREIAVPLHDLAGNATLMREIARKALALEPPGCPTPDACSCPDGAGDVVRGRLEWRDNSCWFGGAFHVGWINTSIRRSWQANTFDGETTKAIGLFGSASSARTAVEQAVRAAIAGGKGET